MQVTSLDFDTKLDGKLEMLIDQFEKEVAPLDTWARISVVATSAGVVASVIMPLLLLSPAVALYATIGGILASIGLTRIPILYSNYKKHEISRTKYRPVTGVCMCDLYQYRTHMNRMEGATDMGERLKHSKLANYYKHQMGL
ncbi:MAG: hypothetical protein ACRD99_07375 [Nitrososphaera sp.]